MERLVIKTEVKASVEEVKKGFNLDLFKALKPPVLALQVERFDGCEPGDEVHLKVGLGVKFKWISKITDANHSEDEWYFIDEGSKLPPPLRKWLHRHRVVKNETGSLIIDDINYSTGNALLDKVMRPLMYIQFALRKPVYQRIFGKHHSS